MKIIKPFSETHYLDDLEGLIHRLSSIDPIRKKLENEYKRVKAGNIGEKYVMESLHQLQLSYNFYIFHNLSLFIESNIQIDILLLTSQYMVVFEVKNVKGAIELTNNPSQLVRTLPTGEVNVFKSPEPQLQENIHQLKTLLLNQGFDIPIYGIVVFPFTSSFIKQTSNKTIILQKNEIKPFLRNIPTSEEHLSNTDIDNLKSYFMRNHKEFSPYPLLQKYNIKLEQIKMGVQCIECGMIGMKRVSSYWLCPSCNSKSSTAHEKAIYEYLKIVNGTITNGQCREFLNIKSRNQSYQLLNKMNLRKLGKRKSTRYTLPVKTSDWYVRKK